MEATSERITRCGYCGGVIEDRALLEVVPGRCVCGRRAITRLGMGVTLTHAEGCPGLPDCACWHGTAIPARRRSVLDKMRLCKGGIPERDRADKF